MILFEISDFAYILFDTFEFKNTKGSILDFNMIRIVIPLTSGAPVVIVGEGIVIVITATEHVAVELFAILIVGLLAIILTVAIDGFAIVDLLIKTVAVPTTIFETSKLGVAVELIETPVLTIGEFMTIDETAILGFAIDPALIFNVTVFATELINANEGVAIDDLEIFNVG